MRFAQKSSFNMPLQRLYPAIQLLYSNKSLLISEPWRYILALMYKNSSLSVKNCHKISKGLFLQCKGITKRRTFKKQLLKSSFLSISHYEDRWGLIQKNGCIALAIAKCFCTRILISFYCKVNRSSYSPYSGAFPLQMRYS